MRERPYRHPSYHYDSFRRNDRYDHPVREHEFYQPTYPQPRPNQYQSPFGYYSKPIQPEHWPQVMGNYSPYYEQGESNVPSGFITQFQDGQGQVDFQKVLSTVNQLASTVQQVSPVIQQVNSVIKSLR